MNNSHARTGITPADFDAIMREKVPFVGDMGVITESLENDTAVLRLPFRERYLRPGNVVTGPAIFALADIALYAVAYYFTTRFRAIFPPAAWHMSRSHAHKDCYQRLIEYGIPQSKAACPP